MLRDAVKRKGKRSYDIRKCEGDSGGLGEVDTGLSHLQRFIRAIVVP